MLSAPARRALTNVVCTRGQAGEQSDGVRNVCPTGIGVKQTNKGLAIDLDTVDDKLRKRLIKNRNSARRARERKVATTESLQAENQKLQAENRMLQDENQKLHQKLQEHIQRMAAEMESMRALLGGGSIANGEVGGEGRGAGGREEGADATREGIHSLRRPSETDTQLLSVARVTEVSQLLS